MEGKRVKSLLLGAGIVASMGFILVVAMNRLNKRFNKDLRARLEQLHRSFAIELPAAR